MGRGGLQRVHRGLRLHLLWSFFRGCVCMHAESGYRGLLCALRAHPRGLCWCTAYISMGYR